MAKKQVKKVTSNTDMIYAVINKLTRQIAPGWYVDQVTVEDGILNVELYNEERAVAVSAWSKGDQVF